MIVCRSPFSIVNSLSFPSGSSPITVLGLFEDMIELEQLFLLAPLKCLALGYLLEDPMSNFGLLGGGPMSCFCFCVVEVSDFLVGSC
ncbi:hypothetical protein Hanom_Chr14g01279751 [Helianthus anomalus]